MQNMTREALLEIIDDIREHVATGDSTEGRLTYTIGGNDDYITWDTKGRIGDPPHPTGEYDVTALYRISNLRGQGTIRMIG